MEPTDEKKPKVVVTRVKRSPLVFILLGCICALIVGCLMYVFKDQLFGTKQKPFRHPMNNNDGENGDNGGNGGIVKNGEDGGTHVPSLTPSNGGTQVLSPNPPTKPIVKPAPVSKNMRIWFKSLFGFTENFSTVRDQFIETETDGITTLESKTDGRLFQAGTFSAPSIAQLRLEVKAKLDENPMDAIADEKDYIESFIETNSVLEMHKNHPFATFQAASQYNTLEFVSKNVTPEQGITDYINDHTQGPDCAIACAAGTVYRNYYVKLGDGKVGQTKQSQVENLSEFITKIAQYSGGKAPFRVQNGYTVIESVKTMTDLNDALSKLSADEYDELLASIKVGIQADTEVVMSKSMEVYKGPKVIVSQVYASAPSMKISEQIFWENTARLLLQAQYEGTLYAAFLNYCRHPNEEESRNLYLTRLGGGVFFNHAKWIDEAIARIVQINTDMKLGVRILNVVFK